ncbi:MAG: hypothetical protein QOC96_1357 [Acidobacteriota bacterium]|jgi:hypothetical protein|nr:hypothetical protein [Acidobacteriota bacterium]
MKTKSLTTLGIALLSIIFIAGAQVTASAQGRGRGGGNPGGGPPGGSPGVGGGIGTASGRSGGRSDSGLGNASGKSGGRSDDGLNRARAGGDAPRTDKDLNKFQGIANKLNTTPEALRTQYQAALAANPNLKFGQFVAANVIASNLNARHPNITTAAILSGLQSGKSIGQTLQDLGLSNNEAKAAEKEAKREAKHNGQ